MPTSQCPRDLFCPPSTLDELNFFRSLLDSKDLTCNLTLALINIVRAELEKPQKQGPAAYRRYSEVVTSLYKQMPDVYEQVVAAWQQRRRDSSAPLPEPAKREPELAETNTETSPLVDVK